MEGDGWVVQSELVFACKVAMVFVLCTMYVKDINVLLSQVGSLMKVRMSTPDQSIYKQVWSLGLQQEFEMPLLHTFITTDQHRSNLDIVFKLQSRHHSIPQHVICNLYAKHLERQPAQRH